MRAARVSSGEGARTFPAQNLALPPKPASVAALPLGVLCPAECFSESSVTRSELNPATTTSPGSRRAAVVPIIMPVEEVIETDGTITAVLAGTMFRVALANKHQVLAHISGKMRKRFIRLTLGDRVKIEMSSYDLNKARIVYRLG